MKQFLLRSFLLLVICICSHTAYAQRLAVRTNALDWLILTPNASLELRINNRLTLDVGFAVNPINSTIHGAKWTNFRFQPQLRYWFNRPMARHFLAFSPLFMDYSVLWNNRKYSGDLLSIGLTYGYDLVLNHHWNIEFSAGIGIGKTRCYNYSIFDKCPIEPNYSKWIPVPQVGISFAYLFK